MHSSEHKDWLREPHQDHTTTVVLHGQLAKQFGRRHTLGVRTAAEAAYALCALQPGFRSVFQEGYYRVIRGTVKDGLPLSEGMLHLGLGQEIHFVPVARGSKNGGVGKAILGAVIVVASVAAAVASGGSSLAAELGSTASIGGVGLGVSYGSIAFFGASILLAGISQVISPQPKNLQADPKASFGLSGNMNSVQEGTPVPVVYGRQRVGSVVASFGYSAQDYSPNVYLADGVTPKPTTSTGGVSGAVGSGGGGKGGGSAGATESPNTLRSDAVVRVIDLLSEGPIGGLVNGAKSIFFNGTPLMAADGTYNFQGVSWQCILGYPDQAPVPGYPSAEQTLSSEIGLPFSVTKNLSKTVTVTSPTATAVSLTISLPALVTQNTKNGDLLAGPTLDFYFEIRQGGGNWTRAVTDHIAGQKCTSPYQRSYRVALPGATATQRATTWDIRMTRVTADDVNTTTQSTTLWQELTMITEHQLSYSNTAYIAFTIDAASFGSQIPTREYEIDGVLCQVPLNYDPLGHTYATSGPGTSMGTWDGASWKPATTSNPCWCLYDMMSNGRYGMGLPASVLSGTRYDLFPISQYCDGRVPSGFNDASGNPLTELRYSLNISMTTQADAYQVIQMMVSSFRGMSYWGAGRVVVGADMPTQPSALMNQSNVIDGEFSYEGTSLKTRHTVARVAWQDPANSYKTSVEVVQDFDAVVSLGQIPTDLHAFGCTSRGLAHRLGKWLLDTEKTQNETVNCKIGLAHLRVRPGDVALLTDPAFVGQVMGGRCAPACTTTTVYLDRILDTPGTLTYSLTVNLPDGTVETRLAGGIIANSVINNNCSIVSMLQAFSQPPDVHAAWVLTSTGPAGPQDAALTFAVTPRQFRVLGLSEPQRGTFAVIAVNHDPNKFLRVEYGIQFDPTPYSALGALLATPIPPPSNVTARDYIAGVGSTTLVRTTVSCSPANDPRVTGQQYRAAGPQQVIESDNGATHNFDSLQLGTYVFSARSIGRDGRASIWVDSDAVLVDGVADAPTPVTGLTASGGALSVDISFNGTSARDLLHYELWRSPAPNNGAHPFPFDSFQPLGAPGANGATLLTSFVGTVYHDAGDVLGPDKAWAYWVRPINTTLVAGPFVGPAKALTTYYLTNNLEDAIKNTAVFANALLGGAPTNVTNLNTPGNREGQLVFNQTDQQLYSWDATHQMWVRFIPLVPDSTGKLTAAQIGAINNVQIQGSLTPDQTAALIAGLSAGEITSDKIASLAGSKITGLMSNATMQAGQIYDVDPVTGNQIQGVNVNKLLGNIPATKIFDVDTAGNIIPGIDANRISGLIPTSQLAGDILAGVGASLNLQGRGISGVLQAANVAALNTLNGTITGTQIGPDTILAPMIRAGEINSILINAYALQAQNIAAGAITAAQLSVGSPNNSIANSCFAYSADGWAGLLPTPVIGTADEVLYGLQGQGTGKFSAGILAANGTPGSTVDCWYSSGAYSTGRAFDASVPVSAGECWEAQAAFIPFGGFLDVHLFGVNGAGAITFDVSTGPSTFAPPPNGLILNQFRIIAARAVIPVGTVAVALVLRFGNPSNVPAAVGSFITRTLLGKTVPNASANLSWTPGGVTSINGGLIETDTIVSRNIVAGAIVAGKIAAGAVTAETLAVSSSTNVIWNPSCILTTAGWVGNGSVPVNLGFGFPAATLQGEGTGYIHGDAPLGIGQEIFATWSPTAGVNGVPVTPGGWVEAQALIAPYRCAGYVQIQFFDGASNPIPGALVGSSRIVGPGGGGIVSQYGLAWCKGQAPANAVTATINVVGVNDGGGDFVGVGPGDPAGQDAYVFFTRAAIGSSTPLPQAQSQPQPWSPGGVTQINGGMIQTATILAKQIAADVITSRELAVGNSSNAIWNSCFAITTDGWGVAAGGGATYSNFNSCSNIYTQYNTLDGAGVIETQLPPGGSVDVYWLGMGCQAGNTIEAQAKVIPVASSASLLFQWRDGAGNPIGSSASSTPTNPSGVPPGGQGLFYFFDLSLIAVAPAGAAEVLLIIQLVSPQPSQANGFTIITHTSLGLTFTGATQVGPWAPGGITSISGGVIKTNSIVTRNLAAGSVTTNQLTVASASNLIWNSTCPSTSSGWVLESSVGGAQIGSVTGDAFAPAIYALQGQGSGVMLTPSLPNGQTFHCYWDPDSVGGIPCQPGDWWEGQAQIGAIRCYGQVQVSFFGAAGAPLSVTAGNRVAGPTGGTTLASFGLSWVKAQAPAGAQRVVFYVCAFNDGGADINLAGVGGPGVSPYLFWTRAVLAIGVPNATQPQPWQPGGITQISAGMLKTDSITARAISAGSIIAEKLSVGSVTNVIGNPCCSVSTFGWSQGIQRWQVGDAYALNGYGSGFAALGSQTAGAVADYSWAPNGAPYMPDKVHSTPFSMATPCNPGEIWEAQCLFQTHRCSVELFVLFGQPNSDGSWTHIATGTTGAQAWPPAAGGQYETEYHQLACRFTVPASATLCTLMFRMGNTPTAQAVFGTQAGANPYVMFTKAGLGPALPNVARMPWGPGGRVSIDGGEIRAQSIIANNLAAGAVVAGTIAAGAVVAGTIAAGAVTAANLAVGNPSNVVWNGCPDQGTFGWVPYTFGPNMPPPSDPNVHLGTAASTNANFALTGFGSAFSQYTGAGLVYATQGYLWDWSPNPGTSGVPAVSGGSYGAAAMLLAGNGLIASVQIVFVDYTGNIIGVAYSPTVATGGPNGLIEDYYTRVSVSAVAPGGTAFVVLRIVGAGGPAGASGGFFAFTKAMIGQIEAGAQVGAWVPGGVTTISGNMIKTGSLDASRITAGSITTGQLAAQSVTATNLAANSVSAYNLQAYSITGNRIAANTIVGGNIQAAAIGADQIAANQLHAYHLAADFALISAAQIGVATIQAANIQDLTVNGQKIAPGSLSDVSYGNNPVNSALPYNWTQLTSIFMTKKPGATAVVLFLKSINDFISFSESLSTSSSGGDGGGSGNGV